MASSDLPEDLAIEILSRLPVKSLMRFRCVSKSWCALVETPSFISKHLNNNHKNNNDKDQIDDDAGDGYSVIVKRRRDNIDSFLLLSYETLDWDLGGGFQSFRDDGRMVDHEFMGCCNGVVCIYDHRSNYDVILWNPATRQMKLVPESPIPHPKDSVLTSLEFGFGFDVKTNDYKVIRLVTFLFPPRYDRRGIQRTEVYSLSTDSWRLTDAVVAPATSRSTRHHKTCVNGVYSIWGTVSDEVQVRDVLISFDISKEVFLLTPLPVFMDADGNRRKMAFTVLNESFAMIIQEDVSGISPKHFELWLLNEYGPHGSLTKVYSIGPFSDFLDLYPIGISKKKKKNTTTIEVVDLLFFESIEGELVLGDPNTRNLKSLQVDGEYGFLEILPYKESLVRLH